MRVLVGCEESQMVCSAFRRKGHEAYSCDIVPTRGNPDWHFQQNVMNIIENDWDLIILHPDCTAMAVSGNRWYGKNQPLSYKRLAALKWTSTLWGYATMHCSAVALENPVGVLFNHLGIKPQYIQPWQFGHGETKKTGLALHGLPELAPTNIVDGREQRIWRMPPSATRKRDRSETYQGIAEAMAAQWGD